MSRSARRVSHRSQAPTWSKLAVLLVLAATMVACNSLDARRLNADGVRLFKDGKFRESVEKFESALTKEELATTHYNLGLAYQKLFMPGCNPTKDKDDQGRLRCPDNATFADKAAQHFTTYLKSDPKNTQIRDIMTKIWLDNDQFDKAVTYWTEQLAADPKNPEIMGKLAGINFKARRWRETMDWYNKQAESSTGDNTKAAVYQSIGNVAWAFLSNREKMLWEERVECADRGIGGLLHAAELAPKKPEIPGLLSALYNFRALAQGPTWAAAIDKATSQIHARTRNVLAAEAKKAAAAAQGAPAGGSPPAEAPPKSGG
jgi:tetratricopeptide (TPR) repeat protein